MVADGVRGLRFVGRIVCPCRSSQQVPEHDCPGEDVPDRGDRSDAAGWMRRRSGAGELRSIRRAFQEQDVVGANTMNDAGRQSHEGHESWQDGRDGQSAIVAVVLNDQRTWTNAEGCAVVVLPADYDDDRPLEDGTVVLWLGEDVDPKTAGSSTSG